MRRYLYRLYFRILKTLNIHLYLRALLSVLPFRFYEITFWKYAQEKGKSYTIPFPDTNDDRYVKFYGFKSIDEYCTNLEMRNTTPQYVIYKNATYHPCNGNPLVNSGLYSDNGDIIKESCLFRGTHKSEMITAIKPYDPSLKKIYLNDSYIYGGPIVAHYGHFLTECVGRLWYLLEEHKIDSFLLFHGNKSTLKIDFIKKILKNLPIQEDRIIILDHVAQLAEVIIPLPSMTNRGEIFTIHRKLPIKVAESILNPREIKHTNQPVYLSRRKLPLGYRVILNERKLENRLKKYKVKIIYPEELEFAEQVVLFNSHSVIIGPLGSAHHANMFSLNKLTQIYLCHSSTIKNYYLLDYTNNNSSHYIMCCHRPFWDSNRPDVRSLVIDIDYAISSLKRVGVI
ncbi:MAG: glycosyltransferase family 61 protein [Thermodesulfovibrionales bacterium]|nr:glycosyltransferase family 61 protein [Thermodesulfovibrionales bacterium]